MNMPPSKPSRPRSHADAAHSDGLPLDAPKRAPSRRELAPRLQQSRRSVAAAARHDRADPAASGRCSARGPARRCRRRRKIWSEAWDLIVDPFFVAAPQDIGLGWRVLGSLQRVAIGYGLAAVVGVVLGTLIGQSIWAMRGLDPIFQVLRTIPPLAWLPISLAAFRDSQPSAIFVIFITSIWPIIINTAVGIRNIPQDYRNVAAVLRLNQFEFFCKIMIPSAAPYIFTGLRIGIGLSWLAIVAAEMLTGGVGIGFFIWDAWNSSRLSDIIVALVYIGIIGFVLDRIVAADRATSSRAARRRTEERHHERLSQDRSRSKDLHARLAARPRCSRHHPDDRARANTSRSSAIRAAASPRCSTSSPG